MAKSVVAVFNSMKAVFSDSVTRPFFRMGLLAKASVAIDGSKFKAVNNRDKNFTQAKVERRRKQLEESVARYLAQLDTADLQEPSETIMLTKTRLKEKLAKLGEEMKRGAAIGEPNVATPDRQ